MKKDKGKKDEGKKDMGKKDGEKKDWGKKDRGKFLLHKYVIGSEKRDHFALNAFFFLPFFTITRPQEP